MSNVKNKRIQQKMSQRDLAESIGISQAAISKIESGKNSPTLAIARKLASALESSIDELFP